MFPIAINFLFLSTLVFLAAFLILIRKNHGQRKGLNLPPGSMGWPLIGETLQFVANRHPATSIGEFMEERIKRYGKIYKTHLMGKPTIVSADPEFNQFILKNDGRLFDHSRLSLFKKLFGRTLTELETGETHRFLKNIVNDFMAVPRLRANFLPTFELYALQVLNSWEDNATFSALEETKKVTFNLMLKNILSLNPEDADSEELHRLYCCFKKGLTTLPLDFPGSTYRRAIKAREEILKIIERIKAERIEKKKEKKEESNNGEADHFEVMLERSNISAEAIVNHIIGILFSGHETSSLSVTYAIYFLSGCQKAIQQLREEHLAIDRKKEERGESYLTWEDYKQMEFTQCVANETLRLGNISCRHLFRKATTDVQFKGYDIPSGWGVVPVLAATHLDDNVYEESQRFDPWRWQDISKYPEMAQNLMPFGQGIHKCPGIELAKMEFAIFLHHLVLKFDWELAEPDNPSSSFSGLSEFSKGLPIKVHAVQRGQ